MQPSAKGRELYDAWMAAVNGRESAERHLTDCETRITQAQETLEMRKKTEAEARAAFTAAHELEEKKAGSDGQ